MNVTAQQFKWTFEYPDEGVVSDEFHVPVDRQLELHLTALDVLHSFWVPEWRMKRDLVPIAEGNPTDVDNVMRRDARRGGRRSQLICTELCGWGHATMRARGGRRVPGGVRRSGSPSRRQRRPRRRPEPQASAG